MTTKNARPALVPGIFLIRRAIPIFTQSIHYADGSEKSSKCLGNV